MKKWICIFLLLSVGTMMQAQFTRGVNLTGWFQVSNPRQIQFSKFTFKDFQQIKSLGCDVVRLPINLHAMTSGAPDYQVDPLFLSFLDSVVGWCETLQMHLIIDNHTFDPAANTPTNIGEPLTRIWYQMANHYKDRSNYIYYEVLNEPHGIADNIWGNIQQRVIDTIRMVDKKHTIIVGPANWNSYNSLKNLPNYTDSNLIYTFHFYDPFIFTHQGASWANLTDLHGVPYPHDANRMPECPPAYKGTWIETELTTNYKKNGTDSAVKKLLDIAIDFRNTRNARVFCGEFGVYSVFAPDSDRVYWYRTVRQYLEDNNIPWTIWDYKGTFGLFEKGSNELFEHDLNIPLLEALGLNIPEQTPLIIYPDSVGSYVYHDFLASGINESSYTGNTGYIDYYNNQKPARGPYCIQWKIGEQYTNIGLDFIPNRDLMQLKDSGYALYFLVRGYGNSSFTFDVRFVDSKTSDTDRPWRNRYTINSTMSPWDGYWHKIYIPLQNFTEQGAWDNGWYNPEGKFDWHDIDRLEFVAEQGAGNGMILWIDQILITNQDTVTIGDTSQYIPPQTNIVSTKHHAFEVFPNPIQDRLFIKSGITNSTNYQITLIDLTGRTILKYNWKTSSNSTLEIPVQNLRKGMYILVIDNRSEKAKFKVSVQ